MLGGGAPKVFPRDPFKVLHVSKPISLLAPASRNPAVLHSQWLQQWPVTRCMKEASSGHTILCLSGQWDRDLHSARFTGNLNSNLLPETLRKLILGPKTLVYTMCCSWAGPSLADQGSSHNTPVRRKESRDHKIKVYLPKLAG